MRIVWQALALIATITIAAVAALVISPPASLVNSKAAQFGRETLGRPIEVAGRTSLRLLPTPKVRLEDVTIVNPPGTPGRAFLRAAAVEIDGSIGFMSFTPTAIRVEAPTLQLVRDASGKGNWQGMGIAGKSSEAGEPVSLGDITISNGTLVFTEAGAGERVRLEAVSLRLQQPTADAPVDVTFDTVVEKERVAGKARLAPLKTLMAGKTSPASMTLSASPGRAEIDGVIDLEGPGLNGKARVEVPSLELLAAWLGLDAASIGPGALSFAGDVAVAPAGVEGSAHAASAGTTRVGVSNASLTVTGKGDRKRLALEKIEATTAFASLTQPLEAAVDMTWNGERIDAQARVQSMQALLDRSKSAVSARFGSSRGRLEMVGDVLPGQAASFIGRAKGTTASLRALARSVGVEPPLDGGLEAADFEGEISATIASLKLWNARIKVDDTTARGSLTVEAGAQRPMIGGKLTIDRVDATRYLPARPAAPVLSPSPGGTAARLDQPGRSSARAPERNPFEVLEMVPLAETLRGEIDRLDGKAPRGSATTEAPSAGGNGWSEEPIDLTGLKATDLDLDLAIGEVRIGQRTIAVPQLKTVLKDGRLAVDGRDVASHGGKISGAAEIDATKPVPSLKAKLNADGVLFEQMFADLGLSPYLAGKAAVEADLTASGASQKAIVSSLGGRVKAAAQNGALVGWDLGSSWRSIFDGFRRGLGLQPYNGSARTPVDTLTADVQIDNGVVNAAGAQARGRQFAAVAEGRARLIARQAEYHGTFSTFVAPQVEVPFRASGPWTSARPGLDPERGGLMRVLLSLIGFGSGARLESAAAVDPAEAEVMDLARQYVAKAQASGTLSQEEADAARKLRDILGPPR